MPNSNYYPVFEPDQVLTNEHLNAMFAYLDQQDHLTRNKLIGIGIVCGLHSAWDGTEINISKGVGVSSLGYLLQFAADSFSHVRNYELPDFPEAISPAVHAWYKNLKMLQLIPASQPKEPTDKALAANMALLKTHVVLLFIEPMLSDLKNCTTQDCNDKGKRVDLTVRAMLAPKEQLAKYKYFGLQQQKFNFPSVHLKRWNTPAQPLSNPVNVIEAFDDILDAKLIKELADACQFVHDVFGTMLGDGENDEALEHVYLHITQLAAAIRKNNTVHYQYVYDYVNDLIKAYHDFRELVFDVLSECCPDENLFPLHLALGEAEGNSALSHSPYRNNFIYSPLFNQQKKLYEEAKLLYRRLVLMLEQFQLPQSSSLSSVKTPLPIVITPSVLGDYPLGKYCIPYYYKPDPLYRFWDYNKSRRGRETMNYGYFASTYSNDLMTANPLLYDTEAYNFFRIEGHAGRPVATALRDLAAMKISHNLPIDIVALNVYPGNDLNETEKLNCYFADLETHYNVLLAELLCKLHGQLCAAGKLPFSAAIYNALFGKTNLAAKENFTAFEGSFNAGMAEKENAAATAAPAEEAETKEEGIDISATRMRSFEASLMAVQYLSRNFVDTQRGVLPYIKGSFLKAFCQPGDKDQTITAYYIQWGKANPGKRWPKPQPLAAGETNFTKWWITAYAHVFYLIDTAEEMLEKLLPYDVGELNYAAFKDAYDELMDAIEAYADYFDNFWHALDLANDQKDIQAGKPFNLIAEELEDWMVDKIVTKIVADSRCLLNMCVDDRIEQLLYEYRKRLRYVLEQLTLANYAKHKTGLEHKAGVPKGGTFVMLYYNKPRKRTELSLAENLRETVLATNRTNAIKEAATLKSSDTKAVENSSKASLQESIEAISKAVELNKTEFAASQLKEFEKMLGLVKALPTTTDTLRIPEGVVFADLYIPYMCCSQCAPTAFVFVEKEDEEPQPDINIKRTFFCNNENIDEPIEINPLGGTVTGQGVTEKNGQFFFNPSGLAEGDYTLTYKLGTKTDTVTITVKATPNPGFSFSVKGSDAAGGIIVSFTPVTLSGQHSWNFGDGSATSTEISPEHSYLFDGESKEFIVVHSVSNGNCALAPVSQLVTLKHDTTVTLDIKNAKLCSNAAPERLFYSPDGGTMICKESAAAITTIGGFFHFAPSVASTGTFTIEYTAAGKTQTLMVDVIPAPDAAFDAKITDTTQDAVFVQFTPVFTGGKHLWEFSDGQKSEETAPSMIFKIDPAAPAASVSVSHTVLADPCSDNMKKDVALQVPKQIEESSMSICYEPKLEIKLETNLDASAVVTVMDADIHALNNDASLILSGKTPLGLSKSIIKYSIKTNSTTVEKHVTLNISRIDPKITVSFDAGSSVSIESAALNVQWKISINTKTITENRTENPLKLIAGRELPDSIDGNFIIEALMTAGTCKQTITRSIPAQVYNELIKTGGKITV